MWLRDDLLARYQEELAWGELVSIRSERKFALGRDYWKNVLRLFDALPEVDPSSLAFSFNDPAVTVGKGGVLSQSEAQTIKELTDLLIPWRKGPFDLFGYYVDAEWQSNLKWDRLLPGLPNLKGKKVADIGCGNGYYIFRMLPYEPECVVGFDPSEKFYFAFELVQHFVRLKNIQFELLGIEHAPLFPNFFEVVFCMGVLYHQRNPLEAIAQIRKCLVPGGTLVLESITIAGEDLNCLFPEDRYAKMRNVFFLPTTNTLINWLKRSGFDNVEVVSESVTNTLEQRKTKFSTDESLLDFLDPQDMSKTLEGYPAPRRTIVTAKRALER